MKNNFIEEEIQRKEKSQQALAKMKKIEANTKLYEYVAPNGVIVRCKNKERINQYKKWLNIYQCPLTSQK